VSRGRPTLACIAIALAPAAIGAGCTRIGEVLHPNDAAVPVVLQVTDVRIATGGGHACAVVGGALRCWGDGSDGQLGLAAGDAGVGTPPVSIAGGPWIAPAAGSIHTCALGADGGVWCWGGNANGQLGSGDRTARPDPRQVSLPAKAVDVRTSFEFTCALLADASVWCWGYNMEGQLGLGDQYPGDDKLSPVQLGTEHDWTFIATGQGHGCGIRAPGRLYCWGRNTSSELGQGVTQPEEMRSPTLVGEDSDWVEVGCSQSTTCARKRGGSLWCWGEQASGALAVGDVNPRPSPAQVPNYSDWSAMTVNTFHTCGLRPSGEIWCAGRNTEGQLGSTNFVDALPSMMRADPTGGWVEVRAGRFVTCARKADDSVWCLGVNREGELATDPGTLDHSATMVRIPLP
jgi:alpha-tubulin suppressor-like RCC1 family protein